LFILIVPLIAYLFSAILQRPAQVSLSVDREIFPDHAPQGTPIHVRLTVTNQGAAIDELVLTELLPNGVKPTLGKSSALIGLAPQEKFAMEYTVEAARGEYNYNVSACARDFLGFFEKAAVYPTAPHLVIYPRYPKLERIKIRPPQTRGFAGPIAARQGGTGIDFFGVREYQAGDQQRQINWKLAARSYNQLYTNVFEQERVADIGLILDSRQHIDVYSPAGSLFEYSVGAAAALAENFLDDGNRVSLLLYGSGLESVYPGYGKIQLDRILRLLAKARPGMNYALESLAYMPTRFFPAKSQLILISPLEPEDISVVIQMQARGYAVLLISPDPVAYETMLYKNISSLAYRAAAAERHFMLQKVRRSGIQVVNWQVDKPLEAEVRQALISQPLTYRAIGTGLW
jgi:uncharacterized protein (DUF58 family)